MNILLIGNQVSEKNKITNYTDMWSYHLSKSLVKLKINVFFYSSKVDDFESYINNIINFSLENKIDHIIALGVRFFSRFPNELGIGLCNKFLGLTCQIHDGSLLDDAPVDLNFTVRDDTWRYLDNQNNRLNRHSQYNYHIGWAADNESFYPEQKNDGVLRVFLDHPTFTESSIDHSINIILHLQKLDKIIAEGKYGQFKTLEVKTLNDNGIEIVDIHNTSIRPYKRTPVPAPVLSAELRKSHLFFVTHKESVGLCVLESAFCGCLVVAPKETINPCRLKEVRYYDFDTSINWDIVKNNIQPEENSLFVQSHNWDNVTLRLIKGLISTKKRKFK